MMINEIASIVVLIGAVVVAITNIAKFFGKPVSFFKKRKNKHETKEHNKLVEDVTSALSPRFDSIEGKIDCMQQSTKDMLRQKIVEIYSLYEEGKRLPYYIKENLEELYRDYKNLGGNSYIDKLYRRMSCWKVMDGDEEDPCV